MIYIHEDVVEPGMIYRGNFVEMENGMYYVGEINTEVVNTHDCLALTETSENWYKIEPVTIYTEFIDGKEVVAYHIKTRDENVLHNLLGDMLYSFRNIDSSEYVALSEDIIYLLPWDDLNAYCGNEGTTLYCEFMDILRLEGTAYEGYYEGNLVLHDVRLINRSTNQIIKEYENINLASNFYIEEEDTQYYIEMYLESMSEYDIENKLKEVLTQE